MVTCGRSGFFDTWMKSEDQQLEEALKFAISEKSETFNPRTDIPALKSIADAKENKMVDTGCPRIATMEENLQVEQFDLLLSHKEGHWNLIVSASPIIGLKIGFFIVGAFQLAFTLNPFIIRLEHSFFIHASCLINLMTLNQLFNNLNSWRLLNNLL